MDKNAPKNVEEFEYGGSSKLNKNSANDRLSDVNKLNQDCKHSYAYQRNDNEMKPAKIKQFDKHADSNKIFSWNKLAPMISFKHSWDTHLYDEDKTLKEERWILNTTMRSRGVMAIGNRKRKENYQFRGIFG